ncbi:unnamed protein product [Owenia fusiformis]|uniref:Uncharacterized protein n=1 Tax=Owenia fusiformis TaxID=6347 RepID=A0A8J1UXW6_OWEFU|nr:unnamed protein product [Owenia fusiformis]
MSDKASKKSRFDSTYWRKEGNKHYGNASEDITPPIRREKLLTALKCYYSAEKEATDSDEMASARKNIGMASWRVATLSVTLNEKEALCLFYYKQAVSFLEKAHLDGTEKSVEWRFLVTGHMEDCLEEAKDYSYDLEFIPKIQALEDLAGIISSREMKAEIYLRIANIMFHKSVVKLTDGAFRDSLAILGDCYRPVQEAKKFGTGTSDAKFNTDLRVLEADIHMHQCISESCQAQYTGDELFRHITLDEEEVNIDMVWEVVDWYKKSILQTREIDLEREAIALSKLGNVYDRVLKLKSYAKRNYMRCMELVNTLHPRTFYGQVWFRDCTRALERYQQEVAEQDKIEYQKRKEKFHDVLKAELTELEEWKKQLDCRGKGVRAFLKFLYQRFPLKDARKKLPEDIDTVEYSRIKKIAQKAILHYHPDKVDVETDGEKVKFLHEEITKILNGEYDNLKMGPVD